MGGGVYLSRIYLRPVLCHQGPRSMELWFIFILCHDYVRRDRRHKALIAVNIVHVDKKY